MHAWLRQHPRLTVVWTRLMQIISRCVLNLGKGIFIRENCDTFPWKIAVYFGKALHICGYILSTVVIVKDGLENFTSV